MNNELKHPKNDTFRVDILYNLAREYYDYDSVKGIQYLEEGHALAEKMHYLFQVANYYEIKSNLNADKTYLVLLLLDTAISYYQKNILEKPPPAYVNQAQLSIATCEGQRGNVLNKLGKSKEAISAYLEAMEAWKLSGDPEKNQSIATYCSNIATVYFDLKQPEKALEYDKAAIPYRLMDNNDELLAMSYLFVSDDFVSLSGFDSALVYIQKTKPLVEKVSKHNLNYYYFSRVASVYRQMKDYKQAIVYGEKALTEANTTDNPFNISVTNRGLGESYQKMNDYNAARQYLLKALSADNSNNYVREKMLVLGELVDVEDKMHHPVQAYIYLEQLDVIKDSVKTSESKTAIAEIENKYQAAQKEKEIIQLQKDKQEQAFSIKHKSVLNRILIGSLAVLLVLTFLLYRNYRQKRQIQQHRISELEKDKQLVAVDSVLKGQEEERSRLARDLHDGLGGMLSGIKYSLNTIKGNMIMTENNVQSFERSIDMLDTSIREMRRVAHNLMPESLVKFGLDTALKDFCNDINSSGALKITYQSFGLEDKMIEQTISITIYRIVQELVNNIMKHAQARQAIVQITAETNQAAITVEDDGKGFDPQQLNNERGIGWINIRSRVDYLKGKIDIRSQPAEGTSVHIELPL